MGRSSRYVRLVILSSVALCLACAAVSVAQARELGRGSLPGPNGQEQVHRENAMASADSLLLPDSPKPTFKISQRALRKPITVIAYGDMRFTNPEQTIATDPKVRMELVRRVAKERPDVLLLSGDIPFHGGNKADYAEYKKETRIWRKEHLRVFPALGNHEFYMCAPADCLENWWDTFPKLKGRRWYSVKVGTKIYAIALDSDDSLEPGSRQIKWLTSQLDSLPHGIEFVLIVMHHPPVSDPNPPSVKDRSPRPNEVALANYLRGAAASRKVKFVVIAAHIHNYERFHENGITYLVSGGGGAMPYPVIRTPEDLYKDPKFPNYNYVEFVLQGKTLRATMYRLSSKGDWQARDHFTVEYR
jgi:3',5'-cyclic AMP phosphodiesterase CpdA